MGKLFKRPHPPEDSCEHFINMQFNISIKVAS
jgi:hypothetical protein